MALVPLSYNTRSLFVRRSSTLLTVSGIGATVAVLSGVLALQQGFERLFTEHGRDDIVVFLRQGALAEGESLFTRERANILLKTLPEFAVDENGQVMASVESFLAVRRHRVEGGEVYVPIRGVQPKSFDLHGDAVRIVEGRRPTPGTDEVIVGNKVVDRIRNCHLEDTIQLNTTPFRVVGVFESEGPFACEIWGDLERMAAALQRPVFNRVIGRLRPGTDVRELAARMETDPQVPSKVATEREFLRDQTIALTGVLRAIGVFLAVVMGAAAVFTATNTMLAALAARTHEIGILLSMGFRPFAIFAAFMVEALALGLLGGAAGCVLALPINGIETGTMNFNTFTDVAFAFRVTPHVLAWAVAFALILGLLGGAIPAWRAARMRPTEALRRE